MKVLIPAAAFLAATIFAAPPAGRARTTPQPRLRRSVKPSEAIENRVRDEFSRVKEILGRLERGNLFASPFVVSAAYYHDGFLDGYPVERQDADPSRRMIAHAARLLTPERKARYFQLLRESSRAGPSPAIPSRFVAPVSNARFGKSRRVHQYALDLFNPHDSPVRSATRGIVMLAEGSWKRGDPLSSSSQGGGNSVIVFDPDAGRFCRYCHLATVTVVAGTPVEAGQVIGTVGNSGVAASRRGHGGHLHFEINEWDGNRTRSLSNSELRAMIAAAVP